MKFTSHGYKHLARWFIWIFSTIIFILAGDLHSQCLPHNISSPNAINDVIYACAGDGKPDNVIFAKVDTSHTKYAFVLADAGDNIIMVQNTPTFNFDGGNPKAFRVWGLSYTDTIKYTIGLDVTSITAVGGCIRLSENVIRVVREVPAAQDAFFKNGGQDTFICFNNATKDTLVMELPARSTGNLVFLVTTFNGTIIDEFFDKTYVIESLPPDTYLIYQVVYTGNLIIANGLSNISNAAISDGCYSVGINAVRLDIDSLLAVSIEPINQQSIFCPGDGKADDFFVRFTGGQASATALVLLDENNICHDISHTNAFNLDTNPEGNYTIRALGYSGTLLLKVGDTVLIGGSVQMSSDCFIWSSNSIPVSLFVPKGGLLTTSTNDTLLFACPGDNLPDRIIFTAKNNSKTNYNVLIVNEIGKILSVTPLGTFIDFEAYQVGVCRAYGVAYTGQFFAQKDSLLNRVLASGCYDVSENFLTINKSVAKGGSISLKGGATSYFACPTHTESRKLNLERKLNSVSPYDYVLTTEGGLILDFIKNDSLSFESTSLSSLRIYGVAYSGKKVITKASNLFVSSYSDGCYSISDNFIRVSFELPRGGGILLPNGSAKELFCPSESGNKIITFRNVNVSSNPYDFIITDSTLKIVDIVSSFNYNFDSLPHGQYFVYGVSYFGDRSVNKGSLLRLDTYSDDCFEFSAGRIEVVVGEIDGGRLTTSEGSDRVFTCPSNLDQDIIQMIPINDRSLGYRYILANEQDIIVGFSSVDKIDFGNAAINSRCRIYGVAYKGDFTGVINRNVFQTAYSDKCYDVSKNYVLVTKTVPPPHRIITSLKDSVITLCAGDSIADTIKVSTSDTLGFKVAYLGVENNKISKVYSTNRLEFEHDSAGLLKIYSVIYTGKLLVSAGVDMVSGLAISDDCFSLSSNFVIIDKVRQGPFCIITASRDELLMSKVAIYPNPSRNSPLHITWDADQSIIHMNGSIQLIDIYGRTIWVQNIRIAENNHTVIYPTLPNGIYIIKLNAGMHSISRKLVVVVK